MKILLDTHIWLWYLLGNERLSVNLRNAVADLDNEIWLSPISVWETIVLAQKGRIELNSDPIVWVKRYLKVLSVKEARLTFEIAELSRQLSFKHQDPADRFIAATAFHLNLVLATVDDNFKNLDWLSTID